MAAPRSLFDDVDLAGLRVAVRHGGAGAVLAGLVQGGALRRGRGDRVVVAGPRSRAAAGAALDEDGRDGGERDQRGTGAGPVTVPLAGAVGTALGLAVAAGMSGSGGRTWCVADSEVLDEGGTWEAAVAAGARTPLALCLLVTGVGGGDPAEGMLRSAGWQVHVVDAADPVLLLGALDQVGGGGPTAVLT